MAKAVTQPNTKAVEVVAFAKGLHLAPRKLRLVTNLLKKMRVSDALVQLSFLNKKGAPMVEKLLRSAVANAVNNFSMKPEDLVIESITVDQGLVMMRYMPRARGSASPIRRKTSHINVKLISVPAKGKAKKTIKEIFKKKVTKETKAKSERESEIGQEETDRVKRPEAFKTSEQKKANTIQQKRRLFNRKSGE